MADHVVITLGRLFCSGGRPLAKKVAAQLGIGYYDKELITIAAKKSGLSEQAIAASEKTRSSSFLYSLYTLGNELPLADQVFILQSNVIKTVAEEGPCLILGRCGDYVLRNRGHVLRVFVYAPDEYRKEFARTHEGLAQMSDQQLEQLLNKEDKRRADYYNYYTQNRWGRAENYDLCLNAALGEDVCVEIIVRAYRAMEEKLNGTNPHEPATD